MAQTLITLGGLGNPAQKTVTTAGDYGVDIALLTNSPKVTFSGPSLFNLDSVAGLLSDYTVEATNGAILNINGLAAVANTANLIVDGASTIVLTTGISALSTVNAAFTGAGGTLSFAPGLLSLLNTVPVITGFGPTDHLNFGTPFAAGDQIVYTASSGLLALENPSGTLIGAVKLAGTYTQASFALGDNSGGQAEIDFACFLRGTSVMTTDGEVAVENLRVGQMVMTLTGPTPVKAIRLRSFDGTRREDRHAHPICVTRGAIAQSKPTRDLFVSPDHSLYIDGVLVPASLLQNGRTIFQTHPSGPIDYFHVEIEPHGILIAHGAETESYLDIGNRNHFTPAGVISLHPEHDPKTWEDACAPLILSGAILDRIRGQLLARASDLMKPEIQRLDRVA